MLDILCVGDAKIDILLQIPDDDPHFNLDDNKNNLMISYGRKVSVENYVKTLGGNASNAAVGMSRLGLSTGLCAEIGTDEFSNFVIKSLEKENVNTSFLIQDKDKPTSFSICINYKKERTLLSEHVRRSHNFNFETTSADTIFLTSLGPDWEKAYEKILDFVKNKNIKLAFNPGTLQIKSDKSIIKELIAISEYLFVNKEEAETILYGKDVGLDNKNKEIKKLIFGLKGMGAKTVIITDSYNGSFAYDGNQTLHLGIVEVDVKDKTGAGDGFNAGFISAVLQGKTLQEAMTWGAINSASVVESIGAQTGLLKKEAIEEKYINLRNLKAEIV